MLTELRPKKELLDPNFTGYKLSLDPIPVYRQNINEGVDHVSQSEDQYSFIHTKVFSLHNHMFPDPWHENTVFVIDKKWKVLKASISSETGRVEGLETVWTVPHLDQRQAGQYNASLMFPTPGIALLADGGRRLHLLSRNGDFNWQAELMSDVVGCNAGCLLMSARPGTNSTLHCVFMTLEAIPQATEQPIHSQKPRPPLVNTVLLWLSLDKDSAGMWSVSCVRRLEGAGSVDYVALEPNCSALYIGGSVNFKFTEDSANPIPPTEDDKMDTEGEKPAFTWEQAVDDLKVVFQVEPHVERDSVEVEVTDRHLKVCCRQQTLVSGNLTYAVDTDLTTWTLQSDKLEVTLSKQDAGLMWPDLLVGDNKGQQVTDPAIVEAVHNRLSHLCSDTEVQEIGEECAPTFNLDQLEECDTAPEEPRSLFRMDVNTHSVSHQISLAGHQWLMSVSQGPDTVPCLCVRHDVDGCVWQLYPPPTILASATHSDWPCEHVGTFYAFGYVAAAKQQKKFILAAPDLSYSVICEASSHVFVYRKTSLVEGELRNRKTSTKVTTVAKQQLVNLDSQAPLLGAHASKTHLFLLTEDMLYTLHIK